MRKHKVKVPRKIRLASLTYDVSLDANLECEDSWGHCMNRKQKILVSPALSDEQKTVTFFHEVIHTAQMARKIHIVENDINRLSYCLGELLMELGIELDWSDIPVVELEKR